MDFSTRSHEFPIVPYEESGNGNVDLHVGNVVLWSSGLAGVVCGLATLTWHIQWNSIYPYRMRVAGVRYAGVIWLLFLIGPLYLIGVWFGAMSDRILGLLSVHILSVSKSNQLHVDIFRFFFTNLRDIL